MRPCSQRRRRFPHYGKRLRFSKYTSHIVGSVFKFQNKLPTLWEAHSRSVTWDLRSRIAFFGIATRNLDRRFHFAILKQAFSKNSRGLAKTCRKSYDRDRGHRHRSCHSQNRERQGYVCRCSRLVYRTEQEYGRGVICCTSAEDESQHR